MLMCCYDAIAEWKVFKRSFDARQKLQVVYIVDVKLHNINKEQQLLQQQSAETWWHQLRLHVPDLDLKATLLRAVPAARWA